MTTRKLIQPTVKTTIRIYEADAIDCERLFPTIGRAHVIRTIFHNHLQSMKKAEADRLGPMLAEIEAGAQDE